MRLDGDTYPLSLAIAIQHLGLSPREEKEIAGATASELNTQDLDARENAMH